MESPQEKSQWKSALAFVALTLAVAHLIILNIYPGAPVWQFREERPRQARLEEQFAAQDDLFRATAAGGNLAMQIEGINLDDPDRSMLASQLYYRAIYTLYPRRVFVGKGGEIINSAGDLRDRSTLPDDAWLRQHDVRGIVNVRVSSDGIQMDSRQIPQP